MWGWCKTGRNVEGCGCGWGWGGGLAGPPWVSSSGGEQRDGAGCCRMARSAVRGCVLPSKTLLNSLWAAGCGSVPCTQPPEEERGGGGGGGGGGGVLRPSFWRNLRLDLTYRLLRRELQNEDWSKTGVGKLFYLWARSGFCNVNEGLEQQQMGGVWRQK